MPMIERLLAEVRRSLEFYTSQENGSPVKRILLTGGSARLPGLAAYFEKRLGVPAQLADNWGTIKMPAGNFGPEFHVALGLALQVAGAAPLRINLIPADLFLRKRAERRSAELKRLGVVGAIAVLLTLWTGWAKYSNRSDQRNRLTVKLGEPVVLADGTELLFDGKPIAHSEVLQRLEEIQAERTRVKERFETISNLQKNRRDWVPLISEIQRILPEKTWIAMTSLSLSQDVTQLPLILRTLNKDEVSILFRNVNDGGSAFFSIEEQNISIKKIDILGVEAWEFPVTLTIKPITVEETPSEAPTPAGEASEGGDTGTLAPVVPEEGAEPQAEPSEAAPDTETSPPARNEADTEPAAGADTAGPGRRE